MVDRKSNQEICNVHLTCDVGVNSTEAIKVFKKKRPHSCTKTKVREMEKWRVFATLERSDQPSKLATKDWIDEKHQRGIKRVLQAKEM